MAFIVNKNGNLITDDELREMYGHYCRDFHDKTFEQYVDHFFRNDRFEEVKKTYTYGMRLRGFSIGCQPKDGLVERRDDKSGLYYDVLVYNRKLTSKELDDYELDFLGEESWFRQSQVDHDPKIEYS